MRMLRQRRFAGTAALALPITALLVAVLVLTWGHETGARVEAGGTAGLNFTLHVGATCDTSAGAQKCQLDPGETFPVTVTLDDISGIGGAAYDALAVTIQFTGVTSNERLDMQPPDNWPGCVFEATAFAPTFENVGCTIGIGADHSTYTGTIATGSFTCAASGTMSLSHNAADTLVIDANGLTLFEDGTDELTINCGAAPTPTDTPAATPTPCDGPCPTATPTNTAPPATPTPTRTNTPTPTNTPEFEMGDVNGDGKANSVDALWVLWLVAGYVDELPVPEAGDVNQSGQINAVDAALILQLDAGLISSLPV